MGRRNSVKAETLSGTIEADVSNLKNDAWIITTDGSIGVWVSHGLKGGVVTQMTHRELRIYGEQR